MLETPKLPIQAAENLTNWKNRPTLMNLKQDLEDALPNHNALKKKVARWHDNMHVEGSAKVKSANGGSEIVPKLIRKQAEWRYPNLSDPFLSSPDVFNVRPVTWEDKAAADQNQLVLNNQFNTKINRVSFIDDYVRAVVDEGTVVVRVGWVFEEEEYEDMVPVVEYVVNPELAPMHEQLAQMKQESPAQYEMDVPEEMKTAHEMTLEQGVPIEPVILAYEKKTLTRTTKNHPTLEVCNINNVIIDPSCGNDLSKAGFVIYSFESSLAALKKDKRYKNLEYIQMDNSSPLNVPDHESQGTGNFNFKDKPRQKFVVYEYWGTWDIHGNGTLVPFVASWVGNVMIRLEENPFPDKQVPFVTVPYLPKRGQLYGEPDGELLEDNQKIIGALTRGMIDIVGKSANGQTGIRKDMLDVANRRRFEKGLDYEFNANVDPRQGVYMHTFPEIPQSAQFLLQAQQFEAESMTGVKSFNDGIGSQSLGDVAAGIRGALDAASKRELSILRRLTEGLIKIGRKIISMNQEFLSEKEIVRVTNEQFVMVRRDDLQGFFDLDMSISTAEEDNNKAQELAFMLQTMGNNMDPDMARMILAEIAKLRKMPDLAKKILDYKPQPDPLMQQKLQLEVQLLQAQLEKEMAATQEIRARANLAMAKAGTEEAKAGNISSDTDLKNLNFVEQESGVTQERQLQLHGEQARSQAQLKLIDIGVQREKHKTDLLKTYIQAQAKKKAEAKSK